MLRMRVSIITLLMSVILSAPVHAQEWLEVKTVLEGLDQRGSARDVALIATHHTYQGFLWANAELDNRGHQRLFCSPPSLSVTAEQSAQILKDFARRYPEARTLPLGAVMLRAFQSTFPC